MGKGEGYPDGGEEDVEVVGDEPAVLEKPQQRQVVDDAQRQPEPRADWTWP